MVSRKNKELYKLIDKLHEHKEKLENYAISFNKSNRLDQIERHALEIYLVSNEIMEHVRSMRRKRK